MPDSYKFTYIFCGFTLGFMCCGVFLVVLTNADHSTREHWSDFFTVLVTLAVGLTALYGVSRQIQNNIDLAEQNRVAKLHAARSALPLVLFRISEISANRSWALATGRLTPQDGEAWEISPREIETLKECIEFSNEEARTLLQQIPRVYQVVAEKWAANSAFDMFSEDNFHPTCPMDLLVEDHMCAIEDWLILKAICRALFKYARGGEFVFSHSQMRGEILFDLSTISDLDAKGLAGNLLTRNPTFSKFVEERKNKPIFDPSALVWV